MSYSSFLTNQLVKSAKNLAGGEKATFFYLFLTAKNSFFTRFQMIFIGFRRRNTTLFLKNKLVRMPGTTLFLKNKLVRKPGTTLFLKNKLVRTPGTTLFLKNKLVRTPGTTLFLKNKLVRILGTTLFFVRKRIFYFKYHVKNTV
ncbi:MAG: hypothetical protein ACYDCN_06775, partial [Bacteroidia bacterium]